MLSLVAGFFTYETTKSVVVKSWSVGVINRLCQLLIIFYFVGYVFYYQKAYQDRDTGIESAVITKVKGISNISDEVMDVADYVIPVQGTSTFCIITNLIKTPNQMQGSCHEASQEFACNDSEQCQEHRSPNKANGILTGKCVLNESRCEIKGWCPSEVDTEEMKTTITKPEEFTVFIKNTIRFPRFNFTRINVLKDNSNCTYHEETDPSCTIFRVGDIFNHVAQNTTRMLKNANLKTIWGDYLLKLIERMPGVCKAVIRAKGAVIGINIVWNCNLDEPVDNCKPKYQFKPMDDNKGYNFRFARYFKTSEGNNTRTLYKAFGIRFDVTVSGNAGKFGIIPTILNVVAALTSVGLATVLCDIILLNFLKGAKQYKAKKFEEISDHYHENIYQDSQEGEKHPMTTS